MSIYRKPAFWGLLVMWEVFAFLLTACLATGSFLVATALGAGPPQPWVGRTIDWAARVTHLVLALCAFLLAKRRAERGSRRPGFPVIVQDR